MIFLACLTDEIIFDSEWYTKRTSLLFDKVFSEKETSERLNSRDDGEYDAEKVTPTELSLFFFIPVINAALSSIFDADRSETEESIFANFFLLFM